MANKSTPNRSRWSSRLAIALGILLSLLAGVFAGRLPDGLALALGVAGSVASVFGLGVVLAQLHSLQRTAESISEAVQQTGKQLSAAVAIGEINRLVELLKQVQDASGRNEYLVGWFQLSLVRDHLSRLKALGSEMRLQAIMQSDVSHWLHLASVHSHSLFDASHGNSKGVDSSLIAKDFGSVISGLVELDQQLHSQVIAT